MFFQPLSRKKSNLLILFYINNLGKKKKEEAKSHMLVIISLWNLGSKYSTRWQHLLVKIVEGSELSLTLSFKPATKSSIRLENTPS